VNRQTHCIYTEEDLREKFLALNLPLAKLEEMRSHLNKAAAIWKSAKRDPSDYCAPAKAKSALSKVERLAQQLNQAIIDLPHRARQSLEIELNMTVQRGIFDESGERHGLCLPFHLDDTTHIILGIEKVGFIVSDLGDLAQRGRTNYIGGQRVKGDYPLDLWVSNVSMAWINILGKRYTRDCTNNGQPISPAAIFTVFAFSKLSPETPSTTVLNAMKRNIAKNNRKATGK
jgi:hypothetical protein